MLPLFSVHVLDGRSLVSIRHTTVYVSVWLLVYGLMNFVFVVVLVINRLMRLTWKRTYKQSYPESEMNLTDKNGIGILDGNSLAD